jgi:hypothetical protein
VIPHHLICIVDTDGDAVLRSGKSMISSVQPVPLVLYGIYIHCE